MLLRLEACLKNHHFYTNTLRHTTNNMSTNSDSVSAQQLAAAEAEQQVLYHLHYDQEPDHHEQGIQSQQAASGQQSSSDSVKDSKRNGHGKPYIIFAIVGNLQKLLIFARSSPPGKASLQLHFPHCYGYSISAGQKTDFK